MNKIDTIKYCLTMPDTYEDYPFHDPDFAVIRCKNNKKVFAWIFDREGYTWINVKCTPEWRDFWRDAFESVIPAYHLNKTHWNSIILDGTVGDIDVKRMIAESYDLVKKKNVKKVL